MRCIGLLLPLCLTACYATYTSPVLRDFSVDAEDILRRGDPNAGWEAEIPAVEWTQNTYRLPRTQLLLYRGAVREPDLFLERAELEVTRVFTQQGASIKGFERRDSRAVCERTWTYQSAGRDGVLTIWSARHEDGFLHVAITIHESRSQS
jgi:hypothetical protein